ncbi:MAG: hypothetical protein UX85_C0005G0025 [Candidatus Beckwithbacteria bacterium GW2011_GWB1_47_15]|uniref:Glycosyltransferase RgtA/B/C/D-like domain-containing protein n=1 Tax=Candidatus Beckwithbacteria bacterium GW2011_GWB1_47_15 TaxID=1618371 RepID=A0A0G1RV05_9BACT|nr:MAG: hypothetical protein UY43_C0001G0755 [Candidatus Beckwithbacteria bacterium GW2011_GWC1_49_16]KKU35733.1 MAG: hypothetical protein UX50_C0002G0160 [Candidatus Beckwithbacteria bacterium GW2011_GWA1_46_30]KKU60987.1 MAG: hypothetical protein UX85_C0005G0025 [Candidatus Beckwithbacteria bacterium GW2011_GWB1_47_15]KKU72292.1 MAG: hypothetical protein UX97_C0001G0162 [Candidatus Beckwithbacteria bacterium GW2011_GWA2_47_25]KKW04948.1 MAG: hypothetical protein UY37_C0001G0052 [Candidatus Be
MKSKHLAALAVFILLAFLVTFPLILKPAQVSVAGKEEYLLSYIINGNIYALTHNPSALFNLPFYYPFKNTLAFSDPLITSAVIALPAVLIFHQPFLAYSVNLLLALILNGFFTYLVIFKLSKNFWASLTSGVLFAFSIGRLDALEHLQVLSSYFIPAGLYFFLNRRFGLVALAFILQTLNTVFLGYAYALSLAIFTLIFYLKKKLSAVDLKKLLRWFAVGLLALVLFFLPYFKVSYQFQAQRSLKDTFAGSAYFLEYLYPTATSRLQPLAQKLVSKNPWPAYLGLAVTLLGLAALFHRQKKPAFLASFWVGVAGLTLSLGPYFQLIKQKLSLPLPLPYWFAYYLVPGFKSMRVPQRWSHLVLFGLALLSGLFLAQKIPLKKIKLVSLVVILAVILEINLPLFTKPVVAFSQIPPVYRWLAGQSSSVVVELPLQTWVMPLADLEISRLHYHSFLFASQHRFVNGYSGFEPPPFTLEVSAFRTQAPELALNTLKNWGVNLVIVHRLEMDRLFELDPEALPLKATLEAIDQNYPAVYTDPAVSVYQL